MKVRDIIGFFCSLSFLFLFSCSGCSDKSAETKSADGQEVPDVHVTLRGVVTNPEGAFVPFVTMTTCDGEVQTDSLGEFVLENPKIVGNRYVVRFSKEGFYDFIYSKEYIDSSEVSIVIVPQGNNDISRSVAFQSKKGIEVNVNGMVVQIPSNAIAYDDTGEEYDGVVQMDMLYLNPDSANFKRMMPGGDLLALRTSLDTTFLVSCGMVNVLLSDENGRKLQLRKSSQASLTYPIPASLQKTAPDTMPLWYFDEQKGLWIEEGYSVKEGNVYKGVVNHFTWWNGDFPNLCARVNLKVTMKNGLPYSNGQIDLLFHYLGNEESLNSAVRWALPEREWCYLDSEGCSRGYVPAGVVVDFVCMGQVIGSLEPLQAGTEVDLSLICEDVEAFFFKFEDKVGNPLSYLGYTVKDNLVSRRYVTNRDGCSVVLCRKDSKIDLFYQSEKIASCSYKKLLESKVDTQLITLDFLQIDYEIKGDLPSYANVFFYDGKKEFSSFMRQTLRLPAGRKYDVVVSGFKLGEIPKKVEKGQKFVFDFHPMKVVNSRSSERMDYQIYLVGRSEKGARPVQISANDGYDIACSPIINYMKELTVTIHCNDVIFSQKHKRKDGYFEPMVIDLAKAGALADEVDFYHGDSLLQSYRLGALLAAYVESDTAYYFFKPQDPKAKEPFVAVLKLPNFTKEKKAEYQAVFMIKDVCSSSNLPIKMKLLKEGRMEYSAKSQVLYLKDSSMANMEAKLKLPAVALGRCEKSSQLSVDRRFPDLLFPLDFVCQHSYESWSNLYACNKKAPYSEVERMKKFLEKKGYDENILKKVTNEDYEEAWFQKLDDTGETFQVNIRYSKNGTLDPSKQTVKFVYSNLRGDLESTSVVENCPLKECQLFVAFSKMNVVGVKEVFEKVKEKEEKEAELAKKQAKKRRR